MKTSDKLQTFCEPSVYFADAVRGAPGVDIKKSETVREDEAGSHAHAGSQEALDGRKLPPFSETISKLP